MKTEMEKEKFTIDINRLAADITFECERGRIEGDLGKRENAEKGGREVEWDGRGRGRNGKSRC